jgi:uncharacterized protein YndB with AHSA1/START domain
MADDEKLAAGVRRLLPDCTDVSERPMGFTRRRMRGVVTVGPAGLQARALTGWVRGGRVRRVTSLSSKGPFRHMNAVRISDKIQIEAPIAAVWDAIENPEDHAEWHPFLTSISGDHELGHVRTCSVVLGRNRGVTRERCVERRDAQHIMWKIEEDSTGFARMVSDWRAGFTLSDQDGATTVTAESSFQPNNLLIRATLPIVRRKFHRTQQAILSSLKQSLESTAATIGANAGRAQG